MPPRLTQTLKAIGTNGIAHKGEPRWRDWPGAHQPQQDTLLSALIGWRPPMTLINVHRAMHLTIDRVVELIRSRRNLSCAFMRSPFPVEGLPARVQPQATPGGYQHITSVPLLIAILL